MTRIEHKAWWCPYLGVWVDFPTYVWAVRGFLNVQTEALIVFPRVIRETKAWVLVEIRP